MCKIINRDTSKSYAGFPYQKRTAYTSLKLLKENKKFVIIPEYLDDIYVLSEGISEIVQVKRCVSQNFTLNSEPIYKTLTSFLDQYFDGNKDPNLKFCFFTNTSIGKEKIEGIDEPILDLLKNKNYDNIKPIKDIIVEKYKKIYIANKNVGDGNLKKIEKMTDKEWKIFFDRIEFIFDGPLEEKMEEEMLNLIKSSSYYNISNIGRETDILNSILVMVDDRMADSNVFNRIIRESDVKSIFQEKRSENNVKKEDPFDIPNWKEIKEERDNIRNLEEKIKAVCKGFNKRSLSLLKMEATTAITELDSLPSHEASVIKKRVYMFMLEYVDENITTNNEFSEIELKKFIKQMKEYVVSKIENLKRDFVYGFENDEIIKKTIMMLIDQCYHSFELEI